MQLPSFLQRKSKAPAAKSSRRAAAPAVADDGSAVQQARVRARRRLIGAVVLLAIGIVGFPLLFETQPRPLALDIPIEVPRAAGGAVAAAPAAVAPAPTPAPAPAARASAPTAVVAQAPAEVIEPPPPPRQASVAAAAPKPAPAPAPAAPSKPAAAPSHDDGQRAKALLDDKPAAAKEGRFVVQVGAYTDAAALREARQKVEKLGLKTYTQVVETEAGKRTRVRVGPFATREEADGAGARLKAAGLPAAILTL